MTFNYKGVEYRPGARLKVTIHGHIVEGRLQYDEEYFFICHNNPNYCGRDTTNKFEYNFSWAFKIDNYNDISDGISIIHISNDNDLKEDFEISSKLLNFLLNKKISLINLQYKDIFTEYNKFDISENRGMIKLTNSKKNRVTEFKFGRFLNTLSKQYFEKFKLELFDNKTIEKIHNDYLSYQTDDYIKVEYLSGKDILESYKSENYHLIKSSLGISCMNNHLDYLDLYVNNPDKVQIVSIKMFDKFVGRALLWTTDCGKKVIDKQYICDEWVTSKFDEIIQKNKYKVYYDCSEMSVELDITGIKKWPYLDTFQFLSYTKFNLFRTVKKAKLYNYMKKGYSIRLISTNGEYERY